MALDKETGIKNDGIDEVIESPLQDSYKQNVFTLLQRCIRPLRPLA